MQNYKVSLGFTNLPDAELDEFGGNVVLKLTGNPAFPTPLVPLTVLSAAHVEFHDAVLAAAQGGTQLTVIKYEKRDIFENVLRQEASYVQGVAGQNLSTLLSSGFKANSTNRTSSPLGVPRILSLKNGQSTQLVATVEPPDNCRALEMQVKNGGDWVPAGVFTSGRGIVLPGLVPGQIYSARARGVGGSTGYSDWSDPVSHMVM